MKVSELKSKVEAHRDSLREKSGSACVFSENGPVGISLIDAICETMEVQERRIRELESEIEKGARFA